MIVIKTDSKKLIRVGITVFCIMLASIAVLFYYGIIWFNNPDQVDYPVMGVDVSAFQGEIDWHILAGESISFAFIKATEGSGYVDDNFEDNWRKASQTDLKIGAYHFFSYDSSGLTQAENFIQTVPKSSDTLPPVVDIEFYGDKEKNLPSREETGIILKELLRELE